MIIKNWDEIATTKLRSEALEIVEAGIGRVLPPNVMRSSVKYDSKKEVLSIEDDSYDISSGRVFVIGGGKASGMMAETLEGIIGIEKISGGVINCKSSDYKTAKIKIIEAGHPIPDERGVAGVKEMLAIRDSYNLTESDLVICLISGGGSALMPSPAGDVTLKDKQEITKMLLGSGAEIHEINAVRKHLSGIKGGRLGQFFSPCKVTSLVLSDVIGNNLDIIASGPTTPDSSTFSDAYNVLEKYNLVSIAPGSVTSLLRMGLDGEIEETPKRLDNCNNYIIGDNRLALEAMSAKAEEMGHSPFIITSEQKGDPALIAKQRANEIIKNKYEGYDVILLGGETTPKLPSNPGRGGRNQHYVAASLPAMDTFEKDWALASVGTDGSDYLEDVAGAIVDNDS
ncbi:MAG: glycerate kinase, partial [Halobacteriota archaeon]|nr:glycerate kinase [Halobacteriota archaeon]